MTNVSLQQNMAPRPLPPLRPPAPPLSEELVPAALRPWLVDIAERAQIPLEFVAVPAVVALSSLVGRKVGIRPKRHDDWLVVPNLWGAIVGRPSSFKTPAISAATAPLRALARHAQEEHEKISLQQTAEMEVLKARKDDTQKKLRAALSKDKETTSFEADLQDLIAEEAALKKIATERRYIVNDPTVEKLGELLNQNPRGLLLVRDELSGWLRSFVKPGREGDREFYLEAWGGAGSYTYDRIGRGTLHISALTLSVLGGIQPSKLGPLVKGAIGGDTGDDGLLQRIQLLVWPDRQGEWRNIDRAPNTQAMRDASFVFEALDALEPSNINPASCEDEIPALRFSDAAQFIADAWREKLERKIRAPEMGASPAFDSHLSKYRSLMPSLALLFHLVETIGQAAPGSVSGDATSLATQWCSFLEEHARKVYAAELNRALAGAYDLKRRIEIGDIEDGATLRSIYQHHWSGLDSPETLRPALEILQAHNFIEVERVQTGGRPTQVIHFLMEK